MRLSPALPAVLLCTCLGVLAAAEPADKPCRTYSMPLKCVLRTSKQVIQPDGSSATQIVEWCKGEKKGYGAIKPVDNGDFPGKPCGIVTEDTTITVGTTKEVHKKGEPCGFEAKGDPGCPGAQDR